MRFFIGLDRRCVTDTLIKTIERHIEQHPNDAPAYADMVDALCNKIKRGETEAHAENKRFRNKIAAVMRDCVYRTDFERFSQIYKKSLLIDAKVDFDAYMRYLEYERDPDKCFYLPRRKALKPVVTSLQELADNKIDLLAISLPPGVGKTTVAIFFLTWLGGKEPMKPILGGSHSNSFLRGVYDEILRIITPGGEYLWNDVFPESPLCSTNAKDLRIDLQSGKRFETFEFSSVGSGNAGKVRAENLLYCDDLVDGIEAALSKDRMDKLWQQYTTDLRQRKIGNCKELHIATRWSVHDVIGRLETNYAGNGRSKFIALPALNENDESNFDYGNHAGFTTAFYHEQRDIMDDASWRALYMNQPIEREGQLYHPDELRYYFELPESEPDAVIGICDTKDKGTDYAFLPVAYVYGQDYYIEDCVCDNGKPEIVDERLVEILLKNKVNMCRIESNSAGGRVAEKVQRLVKERGGNTHITTKFTTSNKETKIIVQSAWVKEHCLFKDRSTFHRGSEYDRMLNFLTGYTMVGKNKHDDVPDGMAMLSEFAQNLTTGKVEVFRRPF